MFEYLMAGFANVFQPMNLLLTVFGTVVGVVIGCLPGLSGSMGIILLLPLTYTLEKSAALVMLCGIFCGSMFGGSVSAILLRTPGTPSATATLLDGYPLAQQGKAGKAIGIAAVSSCIGGIISTICLIFIAPQLAKVALKFHSADYFALALFGISIMASAAGKNILKGLISGAIGLLISMVGTDPLVGAARFNFGSTKMLIGFPQLAVLIGVFAISEVFTQVQGGKNVVEIKEQAVTNVFPSFKEIKGFLLAAIVGSLIGVFIGIVPGTGGAIAVFMAYNVAQKISRHPERFGHGSYEGVAAPEAANNGTTGGALIPMLCLGIPGDTVTSVMLGALTLIGVTPGPQLFTQNASIVYAIFAGMIVIQFLMLGFGVLFARVAPKVLRIPVKYLMPIIMALCIVGAFCLSNQVYHVAVAIAFGFIGYFMKKFGFPGAPLVLGVILGPIAEKNLDRALQLSRNDWSVFFRRPIALTFILLSIGMILWTVISNIRKEKTAEKA
ncbi:MAG: tripartite tricarboxylate transporter permease [Clostridiales bacterium]|nr:tripartite tricarboxylate transporter permease [Clostridiales bacterium]